MSSFDEAEKGTSRGSLSRRDFLKGSAAVGAAAFGGAVLAGCSKSGEAADKPKEELPDAAPIPPVAPPAKWDGEADLVVVGTGGGGIAASAVARDNGASVITIEKNSAPGGASQHANGWLIFGGGTKIQDAMNYALPKWPFDTDAFVKMVLPNYQFSIDDDLLRNLAKKGGECADWMQDKGVEMVNAGKIFFTSKAFADKKQNGVLGLKPYIDHMYKVAKDAGAQFFFDTTCEALVKDGDRIVGVKTKDKSGAEKYYRGKKAVILCAGGFGMNRDMLKKYIPTAYNGAVQGGPMPFHTGECTRMGIGAGADISGYDSWSCWEAGIDELTFGDGNYWHYFWNGATQLVRNPWLSIDKRGKRFPYYSPYNGHECPPFIGGSGDMGDVAAQMSRIDHDAYVIFDADYETNIFKFKQGGGRVPTRTTDPMSEDAIAQGLAPHDWREGVKAALNRGAIKRSDTIEGLAKELGLKPEVLTKAVENWNAMCAAGKDTEMLYPYDPTWLVPIAKAPFYGAKIGGQVGKTLAGLRVTPELQVVNTEGDVIPGLYANFTTAGGIVGESSYGGSLYNTSILGGVALSWVSGYFAAQSALNG